MSLIEVRLRPSGPWRPGHRAGDRERVDVIYRSDALYSAVTHAMRVLGWMEEWLDATARAEGDPEVRFSSLFPFVGKTRLITPPRSAWPPASASKLYLAAARLVPLEVVRNGVGDEARWMVDGESECLLPTGGIVPFQVSMRQAAAVDRLTGAAEPHRMACLEFAPNAGWWGVFSVSDKTWEARVKAAFRLLADSGFGAERSRGWGRASEPQFSDGTHLFGAGAPDSPLWLLSLFTPAADDAIDWASGDYSATTRGGWTDSPAGSGQKKQVRMIEEGSVLSAAALRGRAVDVAPDGFPHPVWRSGFALAVAVPVPKAEEPRPVAPPPAAAEPVAAEGVAGEPVAVTAEPEGVAAEPEVAQVEPEAVPAQSEAHVEVAPDAVAVEPEAVGAEPEAAVAETEAVPVVIEGAEVEPEAVAAEPGEVVVEGEVAAEEPVVAAVESDAVAPEPEAAVIEPEAAAVAPEAVAVAPEAVVAEPEAPVVDAEAAPEPAEPPASEAAQ